MNWSLLVLLINVAATLFMTGLIWMVQIVHYPLFDEIGELNYSSYQQRHQASITLIVGPVMLIEFVTAFLIIWYPVEGVDRTAVLTGLGLVIAIWLSTAFIQIPCHEKLVKGFDSSAYRWLVYSNWIRTAAWTARSFLMSGILYRLLAK